MRESKRSYAGDYSGAYRKRSPELSAISDNEDSRKPVSGMDTGIARDPATDRPPVITGSYR
jgi:hypothetical protein